MTVDNTEHGGQRPASLIGDRIDCNDCQLRHSMHATIKQTDIVLSGPPGSMQWIPRSARISCCRVHLDQCSGDRDQQVVNNYLRLPYLIKERLCSTRHSARKIVLNAFSTTCVHYHITLDVFLILAVTR